MAIHTTEVKLPGYWGACPYWSLLYFKDLKHQSVAHSHCSTSISWMRKWVKRNISDDPFFLEVLWMLRGVWEIVDSFSVARLWWPAGWLSSFPLLFLFVVSFLPPAFSISFSYLPLFFQKEWWLQLPSGVRTHLTYLLSHILGTRSWKLCCLLEDGTLEHRGEICCHCLLSGRVEQVDWK